MFPKVAPLVAMATGLLGCSHTQGASTPVTSGSGTVGSSSGSTSSSGGAMSPWNHPAPTPAPASVASLTEPINAAMLFCSHTLSLVPCGLVTSSASDVAVCLSGCQTQIEAVVELMVEQAAERCAAEPRPEGGARECVLRFPEGAAVDAPGIGKRCDARCEELATRGAASF